MTAPQKQPLAWLVAWLIARHQRRQAEIAAAAVKRLVPLWNILDFRDLRTSRTPWVQAVLPVVRAGFEASQPVSAQYMHDMRHAALPEARDLTPATPEPFPAGRAAVSLLSAGPGEVLRQMPAPERDAMDAGLVKSSKVTVRIVVNGGRDVSRDLIARDHEALGFARVLDANPCYFCGMLASRGAVFKTDSFTASDAKFSGDGIAKVHNGCRCGFRAVYRAADRHDEVSKALLSQWEATTKGFSGHDAVKAWRRQYVPPQQPPAPVFDLGSLHEQRDKLLRKGFDPDTTQVRWFDTQIARFSGLNQAA